MHNAHEVSVGEPLYGGENHVADERRPFLIEGEIISVAAIAEAHGPAAALNVLKPSPDRVVPRCRHFGACGGCQYQHMSTAREHSTKLQVHREVLERAGVTSAPLATLHAAAPWGYRNRVRMRVEGERVGYSLRGSNTFLPISECPLSAPLLWKIADLLQTLAAWPDATEEVEIVTNENESAVQVSFLLDAYVATMSREAPAQLRALCDRVAKEIPQLTGAALLVHADAPGATRARIREHVRIESAKWGVDILVYNVGGDLYSTTRGSFFQVNRFLTSSMRELVWAGRAGRLAFDLFAGAGLFSLPLARSFDRVVSVEIGEPAASDLRHTLASAGQQHTTHRSTTLDFLRRNRERPDLVVMDPPRAGLGREVVRALGALGTPELVYVSCDPVTFAADARGLLQSGYTIHELHLLDMFPQTFHMETVAVLRKHG